MFGSIFRVFLFLIIVVIPAAVFAGDEGLYDPVPPEGSAFVRFIHADPGAGKVTPRINGKSSDPAMFAAIKPYVAVPNGSLDISMGAASATCIAQAKKHYAAILQDGKLNVVEEPDEADKLKSQIIVYNLTDRKDVNLKTADGKINVAGPIAPGAHAEREVNAIKVGFALFSGTDKVADVGELPLERGESYAIVLLEGEGNQPKISYEKARVSPD